MTEKPPRRVAPSHLQPATAKWWRDVVGDWELSEHHERVLLLACETWDRGVTARQVLATQGLTVATPAGLRQHPMVKTVEQCAIIFARLIRELDLDVQPPASASRPPMLASMRRGGGRNDAA